MLQKFDERNRHLLVNINGTLLPRDEAGVSPFDSVVQGGDAVREGLRLYHGRIFRLTEHLDRLRSSALALAFAQIPTHEIIIAEITKTLVANQMFDGVHLRLTLTRGVKITSGMDPRLNQSCPTLIVLAEHKPPVYDKRGIRLITSAIRRPTPDVLDPNIHHNNLINSILAKIQANVAGADDALMLHARGFVAEINATHVFLVQQGQVLTPRTVACPEGITRAVVLELCIIHFVGNESMGQYIGFKRASDGATVGHRRFDPMETDVMLRSVRKASEALLAACRSGDLARVKLLVAEGLDVSGRRHDFHFNHWRRTTLHFAAEAGQEEIIQYLLDSGCDPNVKDQKGITPLHGAAAWPKAVKLLLMASADPNARDSGGDTPLHFAAEARSFETTRLLIENHADVNLADNIGTTPLHVAAGNGDSNIVEVLLKAGADPLAKNNHGESPVDWAQSRNHLEVIEKLNNAKLPNAENQPPSESK